MQSYTHQRVRYRLQKLLDAREREQQAAVNQLALRREELAFACRKLDQCEQAAAAAQSQLTAAQQSFNTLAADGLEAGQMLDHQLFLSDLRNSRDSLLAGVERQKANVDRAERNCESAIALLMEATRQLEAVKKHREAFLEARKREQLRREQKSLDELATSMFTSKRDVRFEAKPSSNQGHE